MTWNYRIIKKTLPGGEGYYGIHEVFYEDKKPVMVTEDGIAPYGESEQELLGHYELMGEAFRAPVLDYEKDFPDDQVDK